MDAARPPPLCTVGSDPPGRPEPRAGLDGSAQLSRRLLCGRQRRPLQEGRIGTHEMTDTAPLRAVRSGRRHHPREARRRARRRPGGPDRRLPALQAGQVGDRARGDRHGRRHRPHRGARRLPLRPRRPPLLHQGQGGRRPLARDHEGGVPQASAPEPDLLAQEVPRVPAPGHGRDQEARPGRPDQGAALLPRGGGQAQGPRGHVRGVGLQPLRQAGCSTSSSSPTPRRCGASRPPRSAPSGPRSGSRACRSSPPPSRRSSATAATRSSR